MDNEWIKLVNSSNPDKLEASYGRLIPVLVKAIQELKAELADLTAQVAAVSGGGGGGSENATAIDVVEHSSMLQANQWCRIPDQPAAGGNFTQGVMVCDATGYWRCNCNCTWTVPSGTTCARFQIWGPGSSSGTSCCCGVGMPGTSGAYASTIIPVTAGSSDTICAGCAYCCYGFTTTGHRRRRGQCSYIQGCHFCNFCVDVEEDLWVTGWQTMVISVLVGLHITRVMKDSNSVTKELTGVLKDNNLLVRLIMLLVLVFMVQ